VTLWRISNHDDLSGLGGELSDGRWHTAARGKRIVYLSEHPAVALVETLVNLRGNPKLFPDRFRLMKVAVSDAIPITEPPSIPQDLSETRAMGDAWLGGSKSALLRVPSVPSPESWNYLLNPLHPDARQVKVEWVRSIAYDQRLFRIQYE
jgi:RES domain-containing protein